MRELLLGAVCWTAAACVPAGDVPCAVIDGTWSAVSATGEPSPRAEAVAVWTGAEVLVFGGRTPEGAPPASGGGRYDPVADAWLPMSDVGAPPVGAFLDGRWTGAELIVWGSRIDPMSGAISSVGGAYDPVADTWRAISEDGPSLGRGDALAWTGSELLVWSGASNPPRSGRYDPALDQWRALSDAGAPSARSFESSVWTGTELIVWGGRYFDSGLRDGGRYDPASDAWRPMATDGAPRMPGSLQNVAVWSGSEMLVWRGEIDIGFPEMTEGPDGAAYDPERDRWRRMPERGEPSWRMLYALVWTGDAMIAWGGNGAAPLADGAAYDPDRRDWCTLPPGDAAGARGAPAAVWTGDALFVWGGWGDFDYLTVLGGGGLYRP